MRWNYYELRQLSLLQSAMDSCYKLRQLFYYKVRHGLLQIATGITKCDDYYKLRQYSRVFGSSFLVPSFAPECLCIHWDDTRPLDGQNLTRSAITSNQLLHAWQRSGVEFGTSKSQYVSFVTITL